MMRCLVGAVAALGLAHGTPAGGVVFAQGPVKHEPIEELVKQLGGKMPADRERATELLKGRPDAAAALRLASKSPDKEFARRAAAILEHLGQRPLARLKAFAKAGELDQFAALLASRPAGEHEAESWELVQELTATLAELCRKNIGKTDSWTAFKLIRTPAVFVGDRITTVRAKENNPFFARGGEMTLTKPEPLTPGVLVTSGSVVVDQLRGGAVFSTGPVECTEELAGSLIVTDGTIKLRRASNSLIVARGPITCDDKWHQCVIMSCSHLVMTDRAVLVNPVLHQNIDRPLNFVKFFEPAREGIAVEKAKAGVRVVAADADKPFAKAGVKKGDVVATVAGQPTADLESFRTQLRRAILADDWFALRVLREGKQIEIRIPPWPVK